MSEPRGPRVFGGSKQRFDEVFPDLEDVSVDYVESEHFVSLTNNRTFSMRRDGGRLPCGNSDCAGGGYEFGGIVRQMRQDNKNSQEIRELCKGREQSLNRLCSRSIKGTITIRRKAPITQQP